MLPEITYRDFSRLAKKRGWSVDMLAELFRGKIGIDDPDRFREPLKNYCERLLTCKWLSPETHRVEDRGNVVIAYRSVIEFYLKELCAAGDTKSRAVKKSGLSGAGCACGCGAKVFGKKVYATTRCKQRAYRKRERYGENGVTDPVLEGQKSIDFASSNRNGF
jgi:hypothetical protein